jgi:hypothetical protein
MILQHTANSVGKWDAEQQQEILKTLQGLVERNKEWRALAEENLQAQAQSIQRIAEGEQREKKLKAAVIEIYDAWRCEEGALSRETLDTVYAIQDEGSKKV